jgi:hypothetical protein
MSIQLLTRAVAVLFGASVMLAVITSGSVRGETTDLGARVQVNAAPSGELGVNPAGTVLTVPSLRPGKPANGTVMVRNQTAVPLSVRASVGRPSGAGSDAVLITVSPSTFDLAPGASRSLDVNASIPSGAAGTYEGTTLDATLNLRGTR